jgi:hypothetical protein
MHFAARARHIDAQIDQLLARQMSYARYCRTRAADVRESAERIQFAELRATMLTLALSYDEIADSVEQCIRRLAENAGKNLSTLLVAADGGSGSHRTRRLSSSTSAKQNDGIRDWMADELGKAPLKKPDEEGVHG